MPIDLLVVGTPEAVTRRGIEEPPRLVIEILSPSTASYDRDAKAARYARLGVPHPWIVDVDAPSVHCFVAREETFERSASYEGSAAVAEESAFPGLRVPLSILL